LRAHVTAPKTVRLGSALYASSQSNVLILKVRNQSDKRTGFPKSSSKPVFGGPSAAVRRRSGAVGVSKKVSQEPTAGV
ncbi:hypothetical protein cypCar_00037233, partial [Cyprinus carpio]